MPSITFDRAADYYDETRGFPPGQEGHIASLIQDIGHLSASSRVIEIGIGTGRIALPLSRVVGAVYGIDLSRPMLKRLRGKQTTERVHVVEGDMARLPFRSHSLDAAAAVHVFHLVPTWQDALRELARVLRPDAPLILGASGDERQFDVLWQAWNAEIPAEKQASVGVPRDKIRDFPLEHGWRQAGDERLYEYTFYQTPRTFLERAQGRVWSRAWRLDDEELARCVRALRAAIDTYFGDLDKPVLINSSFRAQAFLPPSPA
jgi:SAM-dependent methyltransferase